MTDRTFFRIAGCLCLLTTVCALWLSVYTTTHSSLSFTMMEDIKLQLRSMDQAVSTLSDYQKAIHAEAEQAHAEFMQDLAVVSDYRFRQQVLERLNKLAQRP